MRMRTLICLDGFDFLDVKSRLSLAVKSGLSSLPLPTLLFWAPPPTIGSDWMGTTWSDSEGRDSSTMAWRWSSSSLGRFLRPRLLPATTVLLAFYCMLRPPLPYLVPLAALVSPVSFLLPVTSAVFYAAIIAAVSCCPSASPRIPVY